MVGRRCHVAIQSQPTAGRGSNALTLHRERFIMAFDPTLPVEHTPLDAAQMRDQFNALKALIDAQATQITDLQTQVTALQARFTNLDNQFALLSPLNISETDPLTQAEVASIAGRADDMLSLLQTA